MMFWKSIGGFYEAELISAEPETALSSINAAGIELFCVKHEKELICSFSLLRRDYPELREICEKRGESLKILRKRGLYYTLLHLGKRKLLILGLLALFFTAIYLPTRILFVKVEGNNRIPAKQIIAAAENCGICFGSSRRLVRSEKVKNALLKSVPQLQWAGVNTSGCTAVISVKERAVNIEKTHDREVSNIIADRDGFILSTVVTQGSALVQPGQTVQAGQILISGYTECGISIKATQAKGEIIAQTHRDLEAVTPSVYLRRTPQGTTARTFSLRLGKKRIFFWKGSGISDTGCGRMYKEYVATLPGGFPLPIAVCVDYYEHYGLENEQPDRNAAAVGLEAFARRYLETQMVAGQIQSGRESVTRNGSAFRLYGRYVCTEMIGREKPE